MCLPQEYILLLRHSFNPKPMHIARTVQPRLLRDAAILHDSAVNHCIVQILPGVSPHRGLALGLPRVLNQIRLPKSSEGFAIISLELVRHAAFLASVVASWPHLARLADQRIHSWLPFLDQSLKSTVTHAAVVDCPSPYCPLEVFVSATAS